MIKKDQARRISVQMEIAIFRIPPCGDLLVIGKKVMVG